MKDAQVELQEAIAAESEAHTLLVRGERGRALPRLRDAAERILRFARGPNRRG